MSGIKKLAGQTLWYGVPTIASRFLGYLMNLTLPLIFAQPSKTADLTQVYAIIPFLSVLFTYGLETAYFRYSQELDQKKLYNTLSVSLIGSTILFTALLFIFKGTIAEWANLDKHPEYINWMAGIIFFDTISTLDSFFKNFYAGKDSGIIYYLIGNFCGSVLTFIILRKEFSQIRFNFDSAIWKKIMRYSYPLVIVGMGGIVNDMLSRLIYQHVVDLPEEQAKHELGVFANIIRLSILITIAIQAFRMAAEPFFFNRSKEENAPRTYARVMKFFILVCCFLFLGISLYIDVVKWFFLAIHRAEWTEGLYVVPLFAMANIFLGIYYNLSIWYKLTNKNMMGAAITIAGAVITIALNVLLIPKFHYLGAAIATFCCYLFMMITSYVLGQKHYPVPYPKKKLIAYLVLVILIYLTHRGLVYLWDNHWFNLGTATVLIGFFAWFVGKIERKELEKMPGIGRFLRK